MRRYRPFLLLGIATIIAFSTSSMAYRWLEQERSRNDQLSPALKEVHHRERAGLGEYEHEVAKNIRYFRHHKDGPCYAISWGQSPLWRARALMASLS